jgi:hypothetical protein
MKRITLVALAKLRRNNGKITAFGFAILFLLWISERLKELPLLTVFGALLAFLGYSIQVWCFTSKLMKQRKIRS